MNQNSISNFKSQWDEKYRGESLSVLKKNVGGFEVRFNPVRAKYMSTTQHAAIDTDVFCHKWDAIVKNEKIGEVDLPHFSWILTTNASPIEQYHSLLICSEHQDQIMTLECLEDLHTFSLQYPEISVGFNGWNAGASQKHLHAQLFFSQLPIMDWKVNKQTGQVEQYPGICFVSSNPHDIYTHIQELHQRAIPYNVLFAHELIFLIPRKNANDDQNVKRGFDSVFGRVPVLTQEHYDQVNIEEVHHILSTLMYQKLRTFTLVVNVSDTGVAVT